MAIERHTALGYLKEECVVYLIRRFLRDGEAELASHLMNCLASRIARRVHSQISKSLHWSLVDDCSQDVMVEATRLITDLASDRDDFAQRRFGLWLQRVTFNTLRPSGGLPTRQYLTLTANDGASSVPAPATFSHGKGSYFRASLLMPPPGHDPPHERLFALRI